MTANPRSLLLADMERLSAQGISCADCPGTCCTFVANSMMVTWPEAQALVADLKSKDLLTPELKDRCRDAIARFSLDRPVPGTGNRQLLRRRYTCPLYMHKALGCPLTPKAKPFGCLAFNPTVAGEVDGKSCASAVELLEQTEALLPPAAAEGQPFEKLTIPQAILALCP
jgi:hypothetical protein